jgi:autotransporter-associated beta strand protein
MSSATVASITALDTAIAAANGQVSGSYTITLGGDIAMNGTAVTAISLAAGVALTIDGAGYTLDGGGSAHGLFAYTGTVAVENLTIANAQADGGNAGAGGGGGAGLGGGLFIGSAASVTLINTGFMSDGAHGGTGRIANYYAPTGAGGAFDGGGTPPEGSFGAGGAEGEVGGFGGGGGGGGGPNGIYGEAPGFGGGGGSNEVLNGAFPFPGAGGGGLGAGGDVFVQQGGALTIEGGTLGAGSVSGGSSSQQTYGDSTITGLASGAGLALGSGIFLQGNQTIAIAAATNGTTTVAGVIADEAASGTPGAGSVVIGDLSGANDGTVLFTADNTYLGGTSIESGTLQLGTGGTLGAVASQVSLGQGADLLFDRSDNVTFGQTITGAGSLVQAGGGTLSLTVADSFTGGTTIENGALQLGPGGGLAGNVSIQAGAALQFNQTGNASFAGTLAGAGGVSQLGTGAITLAASNSFSGGITINSGTLALENSHAAGTGSIAFGAANGLALQIGAGDAPANIIAGFVPGETIDLQGFGAVTSISLAAGNVLEISGAAGSIALSLAPGQNYATTDFLTTADGRGGADINAVVLSYDITNETELNAAFSQIALEGANIPAGQTITIDLSGSSIALTTALEAVNLHSGLSLVINGGGGTLDGLGNQRGLFIYSGDVTVENLAIDNAAAIGGNGGNFNGQSYLSTGGGGGGAGLGGGLFVAGTANGGAAPANVTLSNVAFQNNRAQGGAGTALIYDGAAPTLSGGGGLGGNGGPDGGGGGIGSGSTGGTLGNGFIPLPGQPGIVPYGTGAGAGAEGSSFSSTNGDTFYPGGAGGASGGGGGGGGTSTSPAGGGGGIGGKPGIPYGIGGTGGFGGGGGASTPTNGGGGNGGFGGGGGGYDGPQDVYNSNGTSYYITGGQGGFGGGGGGSVNALNGGGTGGFGAGHGNAFGGGGGLGAGGDIFVQQGGALTIEGGSLGAGTVAGGSGDGDPYYGTNTGSAYGSGIFLQGNEQIGIAAPTTQTVTVSGVIADQSGSGGTGTNAGLGSITIGDLSGQHDGVVVFTAQNTYLGGTTIQSGALQLGTGGASGFVAGNISVATGATLVLDRSGTLLFTNTLNGGGDLVLEGGAHVTLTGTASNTGGVTIASGALQLGTGGTSGTITGALSLAAGTTLITDHSNSLALTSNITGSGTLVQAGAGTLALSGTSDFSGGIDLLAGTLALESTQASGTGTISFGAGSGLVLEIGHNDVPTNLIAGFLPGEEIDLQGIGLANAAVLTGGNTLDVTGSFGVLALTLAGSIATAPFITADDGAGGTDLFQISTLYNVANEAQLNAALRVIGQYGGDLPASTSFTINLAGGDFALSTPLQAISLSPGQALVLNGAGSTLDGGGSQAGLVIDTGAVTLENLTIANAKAQGAATGAAGLGGGLYAGGGGAITLENIVFLNDSAAGGAGGTGNAGNGGFGQGGSGAGAVGGFGAGNGAANAGGGGLGAGGAIFVQSGTTLSLQGGSLASGHVTGGAAGGAGAKAGQAYGDGIFLQGSACVDITVATGQSLVVAGGIADQSGSGGTGSLAGIGRVVIGDLSGADAGTVIFTGTNDYTGGTTLESGTLQMATGNGLAGNFTLASGTTLDFTGGGDVTGTISGAGTVVQNGANVLTLASANGFSGGLDINAGTVDLLNARAAGAGIIQFGSAGNETLQIGAGDAPANIIAGFAPSDTLDLQGIGTATTATLAAGNTLHVMGNFGTIALTLDPGQNYAGDGFAVSADSAGGTNIIEVPSAYTVTTEAQLNAALIQIATEGAAFPAGQNFTIQIATSDLRLTSPLEAASVMAGETLTINGMGNTLDGGGAEQGLFIYSGQVNINNLTIANALAQGGAGGDGAFLGKAGGGGAGLGGGLFVAGTANGGAAPAIVTLDHVSFSHDSAIGGFGGGGANTSGSADAGGGGLGGDGFNLAYSAGGGGGGGIGRAAATSGGAAGIIPGLGGGGGAFSFGHGGGGGGVGGQVSTSTAGGAGGFGGGGGGGNVGYGSSGGSSSLNLGKGGAGGFGGGGGGSANTGGAGGFGGGGGSGQNPGAGGFGAGNGTYTGGAGGGFGAGGDIFVQQGGALIIEGGSLAKGTVASGNYGYGFGDGLFLQGNQSVTLAASAGQTVSVAGVIADQTGTANALYHIYGEYPTQNDQVPGAGSVIIGNATGTLTGTVELAAANIYTGGTTIESGGLILGAKGAAGSGAIVFGGGDPPSLTFSIADAPTNTLMGFVQGDVIDITDLTGVTSSAFNTASGVLSITYASSPTPLNLTFASGLAAYGLTLAAAGSGLDITTSAPCFAAGTRILGLQGEILVEDIAVGDELVTVRDGGPVTQKVVWTGRRAIDISRHPCPDMVRPIRITAGAIEAGVPERDLRLSPEHAVYLGGNLFTAASLVNGTTIFQEQNTTHVTYHHIELAAHDVLMAEGLPCESYLDTGNKTMFDTVSGVIILHPDFCHGPGAIFCAPLIRDGEPLDSLRATLTRRALSLTASSRKKLAG